MKTPEEIKTGLKCEVSCNHCPYYNGPTPPDGEEYSIRVTRDTLAYIEQLEEQIDLMKLQMRGDCGVCKHWETNGQPCVACLLDHNRPAWEYEGLPGA